MSLSASELKLVEGYMDASERILPILQKGHAAMADAAEVKNAEAFADALYSTAANMKPFADYVSYIAYDKVATIIEREMGTEPGRGVLNLNVSLAAVSDWATRYKDLDWLYSQIQKDPNYDSWRLIEENLDDIKRDIKNLPPLTKWLEDFLLDASQDVEKSMKAYKADDDGNLAIGKALAALIADTNPSFKAGQGRFDENGVVATVSNVGYSKTPRFMLRDGRGIYVSSPVTIFIAVKGNTCHIYGNKYGTIGFTDKKKYADLVNILKKADSLLQSVGRQLGFEDVRSSGYKSNGASFSASFDETLSFEGTTPEEVVDEIGDDCIDVSSDFIDHAENVVSKLLALAKEVFADLL